MATSTRPRSGSPLPFFKHSSCSSSSSSIQRSQQQMETTCLSYSASSLSAANDNAGSQSHVSVARSSYHVKGKAPVASSSVSKHSSSTSLSSSVAPPLTDTVRVDFAKAKECIAVTVRFRPLSALECERGDVVAWYPDGETTVRSQYNHHTAYAFDKVFDSSTTTAAVYDVAAKNVVQGAMDGMNGIVFAYGVTSSGKTHTMHGDQNSPGIIKMAVKDVFRIIKDTPSQEFLLRVSYIELYNEVINDLLDPCGKNLRIREDSQGTYVEGVVEEVALSPAHVLSLIAAGEEHRHVGSNNFNVISSRSHTIFTLTIESSLHMDDGDENVISSQLCLIDLAGSESSKTDTTGLRRREGSFINKSLLTLGTVIAKLSDGKPSHVPFRDSKLTRLLQPSLCGRGRVSLICTITPASSYFEETHNTLKFAHRAKRVEIHTYFDRVVDEKSLIRKYESEIATLKDELDQLKRGVINDIQSKTITPAAAVNEERFANKCAQIAVSQFDFFSRLKEEQQEKEALLRRIQELEKLILVSNNTNMPNTTVSHRHRRRHSFGDDELVLGNSEDLVMASNANMCPTFLQASSGTHSGRSVVVDEVDLMIEQIKMLTGEVAFCTSSLKRMIERAARNPEDNILQGQIQKIKEEIFDKKRQIYMFEKCLLGTQRSVQSNYRHTEMSQSVAMLTNQINDLSFELEIRTADNRILREQLQAKVIMMEKLKQENVQLKEEVEALQIHAHKLADEASYATNLASVAATELKHLVEEVTELSNQNSKLKRDLNMAEQFAVAKSLMYPHAPEFCENPYTRERKDVLNYGLFKKENIGSQLKRKLEEVRRKEAELEIDLAGIQMLAAKLTKDGETFDCAYAMEKSKDMGMKTSNTLQDKNCLEVNTRPPESTIMEELKSDLEEKQRSKTMELVISQLKGETSEHLDIAVSDGLQNLHVEALTKLCQAKAEAQHGLEKGGGERDLAGNIGILDDERSQQHICKVCFEAPTVAVLLPCRHFALCNACAVACAECPLCRSEIADRIIAFTA